MNISRLFSKQILYLVLKPLGVHQGEEVQVLLLMGKGFFMGIFIATYYTGANTLFLNTFDESFLSKAFIASGILGVIATYFFSRFQTILSFKNLTVLNLLSIAIIICSLRISFEYTDSKWLIFLTFILNVPLSALTLLGFWGIVARMFNLRQAKRIIGSIDTGQLLAIIIAFYATPIITSLIPETINFFLISAVSIIISLIFLIFIVSRYDLGRIHGKEEKNEVKQKIRFKQLYKNNYVVLLSLFLIFSMVAFVFVDYSFLSVTKVKYPEEVDLANFLGVFNGTIMIMSFFMQTFVNDKLIAMYGLKTCLMILPVLLGILTVLSALVGSIFGYSIDTGTFLFFFLFISMSKLFNTSLREALENPTIKLFFLPLDNDIRFDIQTKVEGVINQFSVLIAGATIFLIGLLPFINLIHYSYILLFIIGGWIYITGKIYFEYKNTLKKKLEEQKLISNFVEKTEANSSKLLQRKLSSENPVKIICSLKLLEKIEPVNVESSLLHLIQSNSPVVRQFALQEVAHIRHPAAISAVSRQLEQEQYPHLKELALNALKKLQEAEKVSLTKFQFFILVKASNYKDRIYAAKLLGKINDEEYNPFLLELMRDINAEVRNAALISAGKVKRPEFWSLLIENLSSHIFESAATSSIIFIGKPILPILQSHFYKSGQKPEIMEKIVRLYGEIGGGLAIEYLWQIIEFPDKNIVSAALYALHKCKYKAENFHAAQIKQYIEFDVRNIAWNLAALMEIPKGDMDKHRYLRNSLRSENRYNFNHVYMLLSMLYDEQSIQLVKENIESRTSEGVSFAIELLDVFLDEDIKPYLLAILDEISVEEKLIRLQNYFPRDKYNASEVLMQIINQDYNNISPWTKACAIYTYRNMPDAHICNDLIANLFNQDQLIKETSAYVIYTIDEKLYHKHTERLGKEAKLKLDEVICPEDYEGFEISLPKLRIEKIMFFKSIAALKDTSGTELNHLLNYTEVKKYHSGDELILGDEENESIFFLVHTGSVNIFRNRQFVFTANEKEMIGDILFTDGNVNEYVLVVAEDTILIHIDKYRFYNLMANNVRITQSLVTYMSSLMKEEIPV